jgi:hypothetical protein
MNSVVCTVKEEAKQVPYMWFIISIFTFNNLPLFQQIISLLSSIVHTESVSTLDTALKPATPPHFPHYLPFFILSSVAYMKSAIDNGQILAVPSYCLLGMKLETQKFVWR